MFFKIYFYHSDNIVMMTADIQMFCRKPEIIRVCPDSRQTLFPFESGDFPNKESTSGGAGWDRVYRRGVQENTEVCHSRPTSLQDTWES